jgi:putative membrane protein
MGLVIRFAVTFISVFVASFVLGPTAFRIDNWASAAIFAAVLAALNAFVRPIVLALTCPVQLLTLGLSTLVINAVIFLLASSLAATLGAGVFVNGFLNALLAALVVSIVSWIVSIFVRT